MSSLPALTRTCRLADAPSDERVSQPVERTTTALVRRSGVQKDWSRRGQHDVVHYRDGCRNHSAGQARTGRRTIQSANYRDTPGRGWANAGRKKDPQIQKALEDLVKDETAGGPMSEKKWQRSSLRHLSKVLTKDQHRVSHTTVGRHL